MSKKQGLAWHVHHDKLVEWCYNIAERQEYIRCRKPPDEREVRLARLQFVRRPLGETPAGQAWQAYEQASEQAWQAWQVYWQAQQAYEQAWQAWQVYWQAQQAYEQAWQAWLDSLPPGELDAAHRDECPACPWDGDTLFPVAA